MENHTLKLELDTNKRHFVLGDIHARYEGLLRVLDSANYDPAGDILYAVGDLIDRGPHSYEVFTFFTEPDEGERYSVMGNHEYMASSGNSIWNNVWLANGGLGCLVSLIANGKDHEWLKEQAEKHLRWVIDVGEDDDDNAFRIIHAEMPSQLSEAEFQKILDDAVDGEDLLFGDFIWSRDLIEEALDNLARMQLPNDGITWHEHRVRTVFAGHTPTNNIIKVGDHYYLDTWRSRTQSMIEVLSKQKYSAKCFV